MKILLSSGLLILSISTSNALAGIDDVRACSQQLPEQAQLIVQTIAPKLEPGIDVQNLMKQTVISLVQSGQIDRSTARSNAMAAGECLKKMRDG